MSNFTNRKKVVAIIAVLIMFTVFIVAFFWVNSSLQNSSQNNSQLLTKNFQKIQEPQFSVSVPPDWQIERESCSEEFQCSNIFLKKDGFYINISTNVLFTGGGSLGNPFAVVCGGEYSQPTEITDKLVRLDAVAPSDCVLSTISQTNIEQNSEQSVKMWVGSTITNRMPKNLNPYLSRTDGFKAISPSYFNQAKFVLDENGKYLAITYGYEGNSFNSQASLKPKVLLLESPELQERLREMDQITATFQVNPNFNFVD